MKKILATLCAFGVTALAWAEGPEFMGAPLTEGVRACYRLLGDVPGAPELTRTFSHQNYEPVMMVADLSDDAAQRTQGFFVYSERGTLYYPLTGKPGSVDRRFKINYWDLALKRVPGFSGHLDREYEEEKPVWRQPFFAAFSMGESQLGADGESAERYRGPNINSGYDRASELATLSAAAVPAGRDPEAALVKKLARALERRTSLYTADLDRIYEYKPWTRPDARRDEMMVKLNLLGELKKEIREFEVCAGAENNDLARAGRKYVGYLQSKAAQMTREIATLKKEKPQSVQAEIEEWPRSSTRPFDYNFGGDSHAAPAKCTTCPLCPSCR